MFKKHPLSLRWKTVLITGSAFLILFLLVLILARSLLLQNYLSLEESLVNDNVDRVLNALSNDLENMAATTNDWAAWDDTYFFIEDRSDDYIRLNLADETFYSLGLNMMVFVNSSGTVVYTKAFDLVNYAAVPAPASLLEQISMDSPLFQLLDAGEGNAGIVVLPEGPLLLTSKPILPSAQDGPKRGILIMGRYLDEIQVQQLSERLNLAVELASVDEPGIADEIGTIPTAQPGERAIQVRTFSQDEIAGYGVLEDIFSQPALIAKITMPRDFYRQGLNDVIFFGAALLVAGLILVSTSMVILNRLVVNKVLSLGSDVKLIGETGSRSERVRVRGDDEISYLAIEINGMLEALERTKLALERSEESYRAIVENQYDPVCLWLPDCTLTFVNEAYCRNLGKTREELVGHSFLPLIYEADRAKLLEYIATFSQDRTDGTFEHRITAQNGEIQWRQWRDQKIYDEKNQRYEFLSIGRDITKMKRVELELRRRLEFERLVTGITASFISLPPVSMDEQINRALLMLGEFCEVDRSYVFLFREDGLLTDNTHEWCAEGIEPQIQNLQGLSAADIPYWAEISNRMEIIHVPNVAELPVEASAEKAVMQAQDIKSLVIIPIVYAGKLLGFLGFDSVRQLRSWSEEDIILLRIVGGILGSAMVYSRDQQELQTRKRYLEKLNDITVAAIKSRNIKEMLDIVANRINELINSDACFISLWDEQSEKVIPTTASEPYSHVYGNLRLEPGEQTMSAAVLEAGHALIAEDVENTPYISPRIVKLFSTRSLLGVPLIVADRKLGVLLLAFNQIHRFTNEEIALSQQAASQIALALQKLDSLEKAQKSAQEADTLRRTGMIVATTLQPEVAIERILDQLGQVVPFDSASVQILGEGYLEIQAARGWLDLQSIIGLRFPVPGDNPNTTVIQKRQPYILNDAPQAFHSFQQEPHSHVRSWLGVPLIVHDRVIGMLAVDNKQPGFYKPEHVKLARAFADQVAISLENAHLFTAEHRRAQELEALQATMTDITGNLELTNLLHAIVQRAAILLNATGGKLGLYDDIRRDIQIVVSHELGTDYTGIRLRLGEGLLGKVARTLQSVVVEDYAKWEERSKKLNNALIHAAIATPLMIGERLLGVIGIVSSEPRRQFTSSDQRLLALFAQHAAIAVENARLFGELERQANSDLLTGLYNRRGLLGMGQRELDRAHRYNRPLSAIMIDIDFFKQVNDRYSHAIGDQVLQRLAEIFRKHLRRVDILGRYGGEEFAVLLPETEIEKAVHVAERLRKSVAKASFKAGMEKFKITLSLGVALRTEKQVELWAFLDQADSAMYAAKHAGRNRVCVFEQPSQSGNEKMQPLLESER